ncbi:HpcH/HpaI aldolase family protein [Rhodococcus opacus]|uniref:HpcH/HpaI aldolase family protein n=1 Tax=Rhodococcus opacus TaxID=37919 RepID=UPI00211F098F|nr:aldolase/citrate lyase family protein [Rhodococcus opacus]
MRPLCEVWAAGQVALGGWLLGDGLLSAMTVASVGFDYVGVDVQHGAPGPESMTGLLTIIANRSVPLVRVARNDAADIGRALDAGALGVIVPMVETAEEATAAVSACRYPPLGTRSFGPAHARVLYGADYADRAGDLITCIPMIETVRGLANADDILAVPGVEAVYVGPADLSLSLGLPPLLDHQDRVFVDALTAITGAAARHGVAAGVHASASLADTRLEQGFTMVTVGVDQAVLSEGMRAAFTAASLVTDRR